MRSYLGEHVGLDTTWRNTVDGDTSLSKVGSERLDHTDDGHLGSVVQSVVANTEQTSSDGAHEDQTTIVLEVLPRSLTDKELCTSVEVEDMVVDLLGDLLGLVPRLGARVGHDNVDLAKVLLGLLEETLDLADLGHIGLDADGLGAGASGLDLADDFVGGGLGVGVVDDDGGSATAELNGASSTDTTAWDERSMAVLSIQLLFRQKFDLPAPVMRATLPCREAVGTVTTP